MALPYPTKVVLPFDIATAQDMNERHANDVALANGTGLNNGAVTSAKLGDSGWLNLTLQNGWTVAGGTETPQYRRIGSVLYFRGAVVKNTGSTEVCATLPVGFRPSVFVRFPISSNTAANLAGTIGTNGTISMSTTAATTAYRTLVGASGVLID